MYAMQELKARRCITSNNPLINSMLTFLLLDYIFCRHAECHELRHYSRLRMTMRLKNKFVVWDKIS
jgi:hypothetical protein